MLPVLPAVHSWVTDVLLWGTLSTCPTCPCWWGPERAHSDLKSKQETEHSTGLCGLFFKGPSLEGASTDTDVGSAGVFLKPLHVTPLHWHT